MKNTRRLMIRGLLGLVVAVAATALIGYAARLIERHLSTPDAPAKKAAPDLSGQAAIDHLKQTGCYDSLAAAVTAARYQIEARKGGVWQANNPMQRYRAVFTRESPVVTGKGQGEQSRPWQLQMSLRGYGYGERRQSVKTTEVIAADNRIEYQRQGRADRRVTEWYVNQPAGLEQGFTIDQAPGRRKPGEQLTLWVGLGDGWKMQLEAKGQAIRLTKGSGAELRYQKLKATDARGRELKARMALGSGAELKLEVDDASAVYPVLVDPVLTQQAKLTAGDATFHAGLGASVGISGTRVVVGAPGDNDDTGAAYVFVRSGSSWSQEAKLVAAFPATDDGFASSVSIGGDRVVVGAPGDDQGAEDSGAVYVFVRSGTTWSQEQKLKAGDAAAENFFGQSVDINNSGGDRFVAGAFRNNLSRGAAYVFARSGTTWSQEAKLTAADAADGDQLGFSVAIGANGGTVVAGALGENHAGENSGAAYVYLRSGTSWSQQQKLTADGAAEDQFGRSVAIDFPTIVIGSVLNNEGIGAAYVFVSVADVWSQQAKLVAAVPERDDAFGGSVAISGNTALVGAPLDSNGVGAVYVFDRSGTSWSQTQKFTAGDANCLDGFGSRVSIDGGDAVIGAPGNDDAGSGSGSAYVFVP
jgi:FG-GAP repeat protein